MTGHRILLLATILMTPASAPSPTDFAIRDGDTVVFLGDSITAERGYGRMIENYTLLRYPRRKVRFINAGRGGDTAAGGARRLQRDVLDAGATLVTVAYGVNDIGWGARADEAHRQAYLDGIRDIVTACRQRGVRVYVCSAAVTAADPDVSENDFLQRMCDDGMELARRLGGEAIDVQRTMRDILRKVRAARDEKNPPTLHAPDGIHLNDLGQLAMGFAILKGLGAPADVSSVRIDAAAGRVLEVAGCEVSNLQASATGVAFDRLDEGLPLNFGPLGALNFRFIPIPEELNRYMLTVDGLSPGDHRLTVDGRVVGTWPHDRLAGGINISSATPDGWEPGGPWDAQAATLLLLTEARHKLAQSLKVAPGHIGGNPNFPAIDRDAAEVNRRLEDLQRLVAGPVRYRFVLERVGP